MFTQKNLKKNLGDRLSHEFQIIVFLQILKCLDFTVSSLIIMDKKRKREDGGGTRGRKKLSFCRNQADTQEEWRQQFEEVQQPATAACKWRKVKKKKM